MGTNKNSKYIVTEFNTPKSIPVADPNYADWAKRILWLDEKVISGAFHFSCTWYLKPPTKQLETHTHDYDEMIGFVGSNPADQYDLSAEIEFCLEDEKYSITRSSIIFVPRGMKHSMTIKRIDRPILHFGSTQHPQS
jgi:hypothetical protein